MTGPDYYPPETAMPATSSRNAFLPLLLVELSLIIVLLWEVVIASQVRANGQRLRDQQTKIVEQSQQAQAGLEKLARDLIDVSQNDEDARAIVTKYNISVTAPPTAPAAASPVASAKP
jgi:hypothetical protein